MIEIVFFVSCIPEFYDSYWTMTNEFIEES